MQDIAAQVIEKCGGHRAVAEITGVHISRVHRWTYPKDRRGNDGVHPTKHQPTRLSEAAKRGLNLSPDDFFDTEAAA